jgi:biopolymer transport protein ExbB
LVGLCYSLNAFGWWKEEWTQRKQISINTTAAGANTQAALNDVPVLVRLHSGNFPQFLSLSDNAADFRFVDGDDLTPLKYHVERFDAVSEMAYVWVKVPIVNPQADKGTIYLYFGNPAAPRAEDPGATFDASTVAAFHFNEATGLPNDSTAFHTAILSGKVFPVPASVIGSGATLSGTEPLVIGAAPQVQLNPETGWTFETWLRLNGAPAEPVYLLDMKSEDGGRLSVTISSTGLSARVGDDQINSTATLPAAQWHHVSLVVMRDGAQLFVDGNSAGAAQFTPKAVAGPIYIGGSAEGSGLLAADLDELRISNIARSADWVGFNAKVQGERNDRVLAYSLDMSGDGGPKKAGSFGIIFQNVFGKRDAWVEQTVIVLCGLMMLGAAVIMFLKAVDLSRAGSASKQFMVAYGNLGQKQDQDDLGSLYGARHQFRDSPLWRVYHVGIDEIQKRMSPAVG